MNTKTKCSVVTFSVLFFLTSTAIADQVVADDQIVQGSLCVGTECVNNESFGFDTIRLKANDPRIGFVDTSTSGTFPTNDWAMGITDNGGAGPVTFYINDVSNSIPVLLLGAGQTGGIALGANSTLEPNAVSVGAVMAERRIVNVAAGSDDNDAVNVSQFNDFKTTTESGLSGEKDAIDADLATLQGKIDAINTRIDDLVSRLNNL